MEHEIEKLKRENASLKSRPSVASRTQVPVANMKAFDARAMKLDKREAQLAAAEKAEQAEAKRLDELKKQLDGQQAELAKREAKAAEREEKLAKAETAKVDNNTVDNTALVKAQAARIKALENLDEYRRMQLIMVGVDANRAYRATGNAMFRKLQYATYPGKKGARLKQEAETAEMHLASVQEHLFEKINGKFLSDTLEVVAKDVHDKKVNELKKKIRRLKWQRIKLNRRLAEFGQGQCPSNATLAAHTVKGNGEITKLERQIKRLEAQVAANKDGLAELNRIKKENTNQLRKLELALKENLQLKQRINALEREIKKTQSKGSKTGEKKASRDTGKRTTSYLKQEETPSTGKKINGTLEASMTSVSLRKISFHSLKKAPNKTNTGGEDGRVTKDRHVASKKSADNKIALKGRNNRYLGNTRVHTGNETPTYRASYRLRGWKLRLLGRRQKYMYAGALGRGDRVVSKLPSDKTRTRRRANRS
jgi:hypothetical protein